MLIKGSFFDFTSEINQLQHDSLKSDLLQNVRIYRPVTLVLHWSKLETTHSSNFFQKIKLPKIRGLTLREGINNTKHLKLRFSNTKRLSLNRICAVSLYPFLITLIVTWHSHLHFKWKLKCVFIFVCVRWGGGQTG